MLVQLIQLVIEILNECQVCVLLFNELKDKFEVMEGVQFKQFNFIIDYYLLMFDLGIIVCCLCFVFDCSKFYCLIEVLLYGGIFSVIICFLCDYLLLENSGVCKVFQDMEVVLCENCMMLEVICVIQLDCDLFKYLISEVINYVVVDYMCYVNECCVYFDKVLEFCCELYILCQ